MVEEATMGVEVKVLTAEAVVGLEEEGEEVLALIKNQWNAINVINLVTIKLIAQVGKKIMPTMH
ncbi:hypothetical protein L195_g063740, partial [Trifolium pratense]